MVRVLYMGRLRDAAGAAAAEIEPPAHVATIAELRAWLGAENAALGDALAGASVRAAVDLEIVSDAHPIRGAREIAFLPVFSGG